VFSNDWNPRNNNGICQEYVGFDKDNLCVKRPKGTTCRGWPCTLKGQPCVDAKGPIFLIELERPDYG